MLQEAVGDREAMTRVGEEGREAGDDSDIISDGRLLSIVAGCEPGGRHFRRSFRENWSCFGDKHCFRHDCCTAMLVFKLLNNFFKAFHTGQMFHPLGYISGAHK